MEPIFRFLPYPHQWNPPTEGMLGQHALSMLGRTGARYTHHTLLRRCLLQGDTRSWNTAAVYQPFKMYVHTMHHVTWHEPHNIVLEWHTSGECGYGKSTFPTSRTNALYIIWGIYRYVSFVYRYLGEYKLADEYTYTIGYDNILGNRMTLGWVS